MLYKAPDSIIGSSVLCYIVCFEYWLFLADWRWTMTPTGTSRPFFSFSRSFEAITADIMIE